jgi:LysM repeat protein
MKNLRNLLIGLFTSVISIFIVIGGVSLALAEGITPTLIPTQPRPASLVSTAASSVTQTDNQIFPIFTSAPPTASVTPTITISTTCPPPKGWQPYTIQIGDTLNDLANRSAISPNKLSQVNCLLIDTLLPDTILYLPPAPKPTATRTHAPLPSSTSLSITCGPPVGWVRYIVEPSDTLFKLSLSVGANVTQLQNANCLGNSELIMSGETLYVPFLPAFSPSSTPTLQPTAIKNTRTPTKVPTHTPSFTKTPLNTSVPLNTTAPSPVPTDIPAPSLVPTDVTPPTAEPTAA